MSKWERKRSKILYENNIILFEDEVIDPNGNAALRNRIQVKKGSVIIVPKNKEEKFFLVGQHRYAVDEYSWEFPNGGIEDNETPIDAAQRELEEETGLRATAWHKIGSFHPVNSLMEREVFIVLAENVYFPNQRLLNPDDYEKISIRQMDIPEINMMILADHIKDGFSIVALMKYNLWLEKQE